MYFFHTKYSIYKDNYHPSLSNSGQHVYNVDDPTLVRIKEVSAIMVADMTILAPSFRRLYRSL